MQKIILMIKILCKQNHIMIINYPYLQGLLRKISDRDSFYFLTLKSLVQISFHKKKNNKVFKSFFYLFLVFLNIKICFSSRPSNIIIKVLKAYDNDNKTTYCQGHLSCIVHNFMTFEHSQLKSLLEQSKKKYNSHGNRIF